MTPDFERAGVSARRNWTSLVLFFFCNVLFGAGLFFHAFLYNFYLDELGLGEAVMGLAAAALTAGGLVALLPAGVVVDRLGTSMAYLCAAGLAAAGLVAGAVVENPSLIYAAAFLAGAGTATWRVAMGPILLQLATPPERARAFSWNVALLVGSGAIWIAASGALPSWFEGSLGLVGAGGVRAALILGAVGTALSAPLFMFVRHGRGKLVVSQEGVQSEPRSPRLLSELAIPRVLVILVILVAVWMSAAGLVIPFFNIYFLREHSLTLDRIGLVLASGQALAAVLVFASGMVASRLGPQRTLMAWMLLFGPALWGLAAVSATQLAILLYLVQGLVPPATNPLIDQILLERAPAEKRGAVSSWRNGATDISGLVGASVGGAVLELSSFDALFALAGGVGLLGAALLIAALRYIENREHLVSVANSRSRGHRSPLP